MLGSDLAYNFILEERTTRGSQRRISLRDYVLRFEICEELVLGVVGVEFELETNVVSRGMDG
jgi:hypothetical protein